jgi:hypothetical protein
MATKNGTKENRGGKREGAGRKPMPDHVITDPQIKKLLAAAKKIEKETGVSMDEILVRIAYSNKSSNRDKLAAIKLFKDLTNIKIPESKIAITQHVGPKIGLPELKPLPDNVIAINKESAE